MGQAASRWWMSLCGHVWINVERASLSAKHGALARRLADIKYSVCDLALRDDLREHKPQLPS